MPCSAARPTANQSCMRNVVQIYQLTETRIKFNHGTVVCFRKFQLWSNSGGRTKETSLNVVVPVLRSNPARRCLGHLSIRNLIGLQSIRR